MNGIQEIRINKFTAIEPDLRLPELNNLCWDPVNAGVSVFRNQKLSLFYNKIVITSTGVLRWAGLLLFVPLLLGIYLEWDAMNKGDFTSLFIWGGVLFAFYGVKMLKQNKKWVFDGASGRYFEGDGYDNISGSSQQGYFRDIVAIQLTLNRIADGFHFTDLYNQMNLVKNNGERIYIMTGIDGAEMEHNAIQLAKLLNVQVLQGFTE